ncbi:TIGR03809 family protein [Tardiphaga alba]|uniref:TIGR03809 family protein n=1 Tax=Tardiphaga alba TaxID=340268 RepID=A0ABX8A7L9_9BRAD|nr:TIGR03809 family protein [Tardiphaga alba]QUS39232.1 TIGR03809 family protein [Tardiphaga alba]
MSLHSSLSSHSLSSASSHYGDLKTRQIAERWSVLAEKRLSHLTELFETGRWRRFHNEIDFLENIAEAKDAVERWRAMANGQFVSPVIRDVPQVLQPVAAVEMAVLEEHLAPREPERVLPHLVAVNDAPEIPAPVLEPRNRDVAQAGPIADWPVAVDLDAIRDRYPMLRAAM